MGAKTPDVKTMPEILPRIWRSRLSARFLCLVGLIGSLVAMPQASAQNFQISPIGVLPNDQTSVAMAINNAGAVVGSSFDVNGNSHAFILQNQTLAALPSLGGSTSEANGISSDGRVAGSSALSTGLTHACFWMSGQPTDVDLSNPTRVSQGSSINASGITTGYYLNAASQPQGFTFSGSSLVPINYPAATQTSVNAINNEGLVAGSFTGTNSVNAFVFNGLTYQVLPNASGGAEGQANAINEAGDVAGWVTNGSDQEQAALWRNGALILLGDFGGNYGEATALNNYGQVVGASNIPASSYVPGYTPNGQTGGYTSAGTLAPIVTELSHAFLWQNGTLIDLNTLLPANSGWILQRATGINDSGQIVGYGTHNGVLSGFLMTPTGSTVIPGAGTLSLAQSTYSINKNDGTVTITVTRTGGTTGAVSMQFATAPGTAEAGADFSPTYQTVSFANGQGGSQTITIPIVDDPSVVTNQSFNVRIFWIAGGAAQGTTTVAAVNVVAPPFDVWRGQNFTTQELSEPTVSGVSAAPAGDGLGNLLKYALGLNPRTPSSESVVSVGVNSNLNALELTYTAIKSATDVSFTVEVSPDMVNWSLGVAATTLVGTTDHGTTRTITVKSNTSASTASRQFMRLRVTRLP